MHSKTGRAINVSGINSIAISDRNNLFTNGSVLGGWNGDRANLTAWQSASNRDLNSLSIDPIYRDSVDLHVSAVALNAAATPISSVPFDFDGQSRDPNTPDIGADEFSTAQNEAALLSFVSPRKPFAAGETDVIVRLLNNANTPLTSPRSTGK